MLELDEKTPELPLIEAITPITQKRFIQQKVINNIQGTPVGKITQVPAIYAHYTVNCLRQGESLSIEKRDEALQKAAELFMNGKLCGLTVEDYVAKVVSVTGLPEHIIKNAVRSIAYATASGVHLAKLGIPQGVPEDNTGRVLENGCAQSVRRGDVLAVIAPGNGPGVHAIWPQAIALGYRVILRPSDREPYTAQRLIQAMSESGLGNYAAMLPSDHSLVDELLEFADLSVIYGGKALVDRFAYRSDVLVQGPGLSKIVIGADYPRNAALELVFESVMGLGGAACVCTSSVLVEGDAVAFAHEFYAYASERLKNESEQHHYLPQLSAERYSWWSEQVTQYADFLVQPPDVFDTLSGVKRVMPLIMLAESFDSPLIQSEFPVAAVTFVPFRCDDDLDVIAPALVVTVASKKPSLISRISDIPAIRNLYIGQVPTVWMQPHVPHDAFIAEFLMTTRGYRVAYPASMSG
ncbi:aldehyde dehydrogenase family protein [Xenorhabdus szentirmaii]|uniref:Phenazine antibiotic biosynthesis protein n=1 Tax=Xenorhabdus szentirmaii DSM 16338 TaxID=1427518 RepID=W1IU40_9GAMM|nr:aldehyde dehydrogenase family protein [Xenorhabdus szentirmaii]PHM32432.1 5-carboxymethyl-2-hydroxymuconate semialdehyde dehydrogenase [Xenorhabdus szentirmaii DSM 16338]PHM41266.1 5-carboxymethyl-2-hydroxymuconate semialdehyde dehydrogenase [Xenorhabdus szentirmaii]CDL80745.1 putative phenazine antibiotic biosynthesis protein [Xenorhabdus szentirmaii DSM 16338]